jgi:hypothetical protein
MKPDRRLLGYFLKKRDGIGVPVARLGAGAAQIAPPAGDREMAFGSC